MKAKDVLRKDKQLAEREKKGYFTLEDGSKSTDEKNAKLFKKKTPKAKKDDETDSEEEALICKPKRAQSAYMYFSVPWIKNLRDKKTDDSLANTDFMKMAGARWNEMKDHEKTEFENLAKADKIRHEKQCAELEKKGYFILDDGSKSTDEKNIPAPKKKSRRVRKEKSPEEKKEEPKRKSL